jgi:hypothetical protein
VLEAERYFVILKDPPPLNDSDQDYNDGDDQQDMNEITHRIAAQLNGALVSFNTDL